jgi:glucosamine kinase
LGCEALRRVLLAHDGRIIWSDLLRTIFDEFDNDPHAIVRWTQTASPGDFGSLAPHVFEYTSRGDPVGGELVQLAAGHIDALAARLVAIGATRLALVGGCAPFLRPWLREKTESHLIEPAGDALDGALQLARSAHRLK